MEMEAQGKKLKMLEHENENLKARERHQLATNKGGGASSPARDKKKIENLEKLVESLQLQNAVSHVRVT